MGGAGILDLDIVCMVLEEVETDCMLVAVDTAEDAIEVVDEEEDEVNDEEAFMSEDCSPEIHDYMPQKDSNKKLF